MDKFQNDSAAAGIVILHGSCPVNKDTAPEQCEQRADNKMEYA